MTLLTLAGLHRQRAIRVIVPWVVGGVLLTLWLFNEVWSVLGQIFEYDSNIAVLTAIVASLVAGLLYAVADREVERDPLTAANASYASD
jgi:uncharacterized membrane protein YqhA